MNIVIDLGSILTFIFWAVVIIGGIALIGSVISGVSESAQEANKSAKKAHFERTLLTDIFQTMGLNSIQYIDATIDKTKFDEAMDIYYQKMNELVDLKEDLPQFEKSSADKFADSLFKYTNLAPHLRLIVDYRFDDNYKDAYKKVLKSFKEASLKKDKYGGISEIKVGSTRIAIRDNGERSYGYGDDEYYFRDIDVFSGNKKVLDIELRGEMYESDGDYFISIFKPNSWILDILRLGDELKEQFKVEEEKHDVSSKKSRYL